MNFLAMDKIFCLRQKIFVPDKFNFVLDKTYFVWAYGMSIKHKYDKNVIYEANAVKNRVYLKVHFAEY